MCVCGVGGGGGGGRWMDMKKHENFTALATCTYLQLGSCNIVPTSYLHVLNWLGRLRASLLKIKQIQEKKDQLSSYKNIMLLYSKS